MSYMCIKFYDEFQTIHSNFKPTFGLRCRLTSVSWVYCDKTTADNITRFSLQSSSVSMVSLKRNLKWVSSISDDPGSAYVGGGLWLCETVATAAYIWRQTTSGQTTNHWDTYKTAVAARVNNTVWAIHCRVQQLWQSVGTTATSRLLALYGLNLCLLNNTHASTFTAGVREFESHQQLSVGYDTVKHVK